MAAVRELWTPPHAIEAERALLGSLLIAPRLWAQVANRVSTDDFFRKSHARIFAAIAASAERGDAIDAVSIAATLARSGELDACDGAEYLAGLVDETPSALVAEAYAQTVRDRAVLRRLHEAGSQIMRMVRAPSHEHTSAELLSDAMRLLQNLATTARSGDSGLVDAQTLIGELVDDLERRREGERGLSVGLPDFDRLTNGLEPGDLVVVAGRPGMGKTALLVSMSAHVSRSKGVAVFSAEMPASQLMRRCVALLGGVSQSTLREAQKLTDDDWDRIGDAAVALGRRNLWVDDTSTPKLSHIRAETMALASRTELGLVMVDYAQLVQGEGANRYEQLRDVAYGLKALAKELGVPVIALAQLNRSVEQRDDRRPRLSDLRDSGAIEEAADIIGLLYCEGYYNPEFPMPYVLECEIGKNRNGERGDCLWRFAGAFSRVGTLESGAREQYLRRLAQGKRRPADDDL